MSEDLIVEEQSYFWTIMQYTVPAALISSAFAFDGFVSHIWSDAP